MNAITVTRSPHLQGCAGAFAKNLNRITMFSVALAEVGFNARIDQFFYDKATFNVTGRLDTTPEKLLFPETREMAEKIAADSARQNAKLSREQREALMVSYGIQYIEDYSVSSAHMGDAVKALFESVVLTSWTALTDWPAWKPSVSAG